MVAIGLWNRGEPAFELELWSLSLAQPVFLGVKYLYSLSQTFFNRCLKQQQQTLKFP